jgi:hypothetical protein
MIWKHCWVLVFLVLLGCGQKTVDPEAARKLSDEFMSDLIAHRADAAFDKMEREFSTTMPRRDFAPKLDKLFQYWYCGWPQDSELKDVPALCNSRERGFILSTVKHGVQHSLVLKDNRVFVEIDGPSLAIVTDALSPTTRSTGDKV